MITAVVALAVLGQTGSEWTPLFNGKNLDGWTPKITGYDYGVNFGNTFRVASGVIQVNYDQYNGEFKGRFGHLFYKSPYQSYVLRLEYRFTGTQIKDGPGWANRNSGVMFHCQDPKTMTKDQNFPVSLELQFLGGLGSGKRSTGNICTPGTNIIYQNKLWTQHCTDSTSQTYDGDQWVKCELEVWPGGQIIHRINGEKVLQYSGAQLDPNDADAKPVIAAAAGELKLRRGWISLQSESSPVEFRKIEIRPLK